jgi:hypothetical protein
VDHVVEALNALRQHSSTIALIITWVGIAFVYWRRRVQWARKQFMNQVNFSLNYVTNDAIAMRTLLETTAQHVWLNEYGVKKVFAAAQKTTVENPFIVLDDQADQDFINRAVLNVLSERFAESFLAQALGVPVQHGNFCFAITFERFDEIRTLKTRVLIMEEQLMIRMFGAENLAAKVQIPHEVYKQRLKTLKAMHDVYMRDKTSKKQALGYMEMGVHP